MNTLFQSTRHFKVWRYLISHGQLLLRSVPTDSEPYRIEVLFRDVHAVKITTELNELVIREPSEQELFIISEDVRVSMSTLGLKAFMIESSSYRGYVVASDVATAKDQGDYKTPSSLMIGT